MAIGFESDKKAYSIDTLRSPECCLAGIVVAVTNIIILEQELLFERLLRVKY